MKGRTLALLLDLTPSPPWNGGEGRGEEVRGCPCLARQPALGTKTAPLGIFRQALERLKKYCSHSERGFLGFGERRRSSAFGEGAGS